jgi:imidazolonepropionase-like amidohydrolase
MKATTALILLISFAATLVGQTQNEFIRVNAPVVALTHVRIIDGTGAAPVEDQTVVVAEGKIRSIGPSASTTVPGGAQTLDLAGYSVLPGLVGMHNHIFFPEGGTPPIYSDMAISFPRLYLALGVTTIRTAGSVAPYTDLEIKKRIDDGP